MKEKRKFLIILFSFILLIVLGTVGYMEILNLDFNEALYMTVITVSTLGYREVGGTTVVSMYFTMILIFLGLGLAGYIFTSMVNFFIDGELKEIWGRKNMENKILKLENHYILCGAGENGSYAVKQFKKSNVPFIVIDSDEHIVNSLLEEGVLAILGDATREETLEKARIKNANGLISSLPSDAANVFTVLTARQMNEDLYIVSRSIEKKAHEKLLRAGANNTISPNEIGGRRMASLMLRPNVISFLDVITHAGEITLDLEDVTIFKGSDLINKSLRNSDIHQKTGLIVLALKKHNHKDLMFNPTSNEILGLGDSMIVLGTEEQVNKLRELACDNGQRVL